MNASLREHGGPGAERPPRARPERLRTAFRALIDAMGASADADDETAERASDLWLAHLLAGQGHSPAEALGRGTASAVQTPVLVENLGFHMVCPHHLTVALGTAAIAYVPGGRMVGFGRLAELVRCCTARLTLQETATARIAETLQAQLEARAVAVRLQAHHPCHNLLHPRSHDARATTWAVCGKAEVAATLQQYMGAEAVQPQRQ